MPDETDSQKPPRLPIANDPDGFPTESSPTKLIALPFQLIAAETSVVLRRGSIQFMIIGARALETLQVVIDALHGSGATADEIAAQFAQPDRPSVLEMIDKLVAHKFVVQAGHDLIPIGDETPLDVFYWHFGVSTADATSRLNSVHVTVVGVNNISKQLLLALSA